MAELRVDIASEFTGKKAFDKAGKATNSLDKAVGKLGKQLASVFAITKVVAFGKASVKAFVDDEAAASRLATAVTNLGYAFAQPQIDNYISKLESSSSVADDLLRPAFQALLTTTGSLTTSQEVLTTAIEASRASGVDLTTVAQDLANAYVGNTKGLKKYNLGLTQAELKTMSFTQVQEKFNQQFAGANQAYLATYAGKLNVLTVAAGNAQETIGKGLVDALVLAGGKDGDVQDVADAMANLSDYTADAIRGAGILAGKLTDIDKKQTGGFLSKLFAKNFELGWIGQLNKLGQEVDRPTAGRRFMGGQQANLYDSEAAAQKRIAEQQAKLLKAQEKAAKALTAEQKKQAALKKAGSIFDLEQVQLIAALKGKLSDEERKRVELQFAIITGNVSEAQKLTYELARAQGFSVAIAKDLASMDFKNNPFASWEAYLDKLLKKAQDLAKVGTGGGGGGAATPITPALTPEDRARLLAPVNPNGVSTIGEYIRQLDLAGTSTLPTPAPSMGTGQGGSVAENYRLNQIVVQIDGKQVAAALQDSSMSGTASSVNRLTGGWSL
ncbi:hypothetical protein UFOVP550_8 [uncultured Caudovirales phage]|uniref:Uncharacterized protein n=1 Tax=uncultured Caudovirales phage TaxID=2100421 RepID=A0A6J5MX71_9CAUD|nr:hypothetical protein UFOVP550_8 [uncultured Caudovirales phage]